MRGKQRDRETERQRETERDREIASLPCKDPQLSLLTGPRSGRSWNTFIQ